MAITKRNPNTIHLGGPLVVDAELAASEAVTPGMLVEKIDNSGALEWGLHDTADDPVYKAVALEQIEMNKGIDDAYSAGDLMKVGRLSSGSQFYGIVPSGQDITQGALLQSNGDGKLKAAATGFVEFVAVETVGSVSADTRLRVEVL